MVNKFKNKVGVTSVILTFLALSIQANAQNLTKYYVSSLQQQGILYFIFPQKNFKTPSKEDFIYDITYLNSSDSATINFSYYDKESVILDSIVLKSSNIEYRSKVKRIFIDKEKGNWHYRYTFKVPFTKLLTFYKTPDPSLNIVTDKGTRSLPVSEQWKKNVKPTVQIFHIIQKNK